MDCSMSEAPLSISKRIGEILKKYGPPM